MLGKQKCRILKEIRQRIADENDIPYVTRECRHQGECAGTCPRCECELRYLEEQLARREALGKQVAVAALCAGMALSTAGCSVADVTDSIIRKAGLDEGKTVKTEPTEPPEIFVTTGEVAWPEEPEPLPPEEFELMGDVAYFPEAEVNG